MRTITEVKAGTAARITGIDLKAPIPAEDFRWLEAAFEKYPVLVFPAQFLDEAQQLAFASLWGPLEAPVSPYVFTKEDRRRVAAEFADISNLDEDGQLLSQNDNRRLVNRANQLWHTDSSFKRTPAKLSILAAQVVAAEGGETEFADMRRAFEALPAQRQAELLDLVATHDYYHSRVQVGLDPASISEERRKLLPAVPQRLVRTSASGRKSLYLASHIREIRGIDPQRGAALVAELTEHATRAEFVYRHQWTVGDAVMWDNRCTMHRGRPSPEGQVRAMRRATVADVGPTI
jgi:alpha-ketoglutarate-dependent 2,4-dichlorophenoxyacetate dioxygenase